jgi:hypothetical protein
MVWKKAGYSILIRQQVTLETKQERETKVGRKQTKEGRVAMQ